MLGIHIGITLPAGVAAGVLRRKMIDAVEQAAEFNTDWYLAEWRAGRKPPCCAECGGILYAPDPPGYLISVDTAPVVVSKGKASCGSVVAMGLGHERAEAISKGMSREEARRTWLPWITTENNDERGFVCHARIKTPKGIENPVAELKRAS